MSRGNWQTLKQHEQLKPGNSITEKVERYIQTWENRCYSELPDEVPALLAATLRAPSYKAIAMAILRNNPNELGFSIHSSLAEALERQHDNQRDLWG